MDFGDGKYVDGDNLANLTSALARRALNDLTAVIQRLLDLVQQSMDEANPEGHG
jgi:hypothetical protein